MLKKAADDLDEACKPKTGYAPSLFPFALGAGDGHEKDNNQRQHEKYGIEKIRDGESIVHRDAFLDNNKLAFQQMNVAVIPTSIAATSGLSTEVNSGVTTPTAKNTAPALSQILERRSNWDWVNTGSFQKYTMPNDSITSHDSGIPFIRQAYAADGGSGQAGGAGCAIARVVAPVLRSAASFTRTTLWQMPNRVIISRAARWQRGGDMRRNSLQIQAAQCAGGKKVSSFSIDPIGGYLVVPPSFTWDVMRTGRIGVIVRSYYIESKNGETWSSQPVNGTTSGSWIGANTYYPYFSMGVRVKNPLNGQDKKIFFNWSNPTDYGNKELCYEVDASGKPTAVYIRDSHPVFP